MHGVVLEAEVKGVHACLTNGLWSGDTWRQLDGGMCLDRGTVTQNGGTGGPDLIVRLFSLFLHFHRLRPSWAVGGGAGTQLTGAGRRAFAMQESNAHSKGMHRETSAGGGAQQRTKAFCNCGPVGLGVQERCNLHGGGGWSGG